jgi:hypothetical protein
MNKKKNPGFSGFSFFIYGWCRMSTMRTAAHDRMQVITTSVEATIAARPLSLVFSSSGMISGSMEGAFISIFSFLKYYSTFFYEIYESFI